MSIKSQFAGIRTIREIVQPLLDDPRLLMNFTDVSKIGGSYDTPTRVITLEYLLAEPDDGHPLNTRFNLSDPPATPVE